MILNNANDRLFRKPFFSVIITAYNRAALLKRALNSLALQTESDWEAIIIDDGSTDDTELQILSYLKQPEKFKYIKHKSKGDTASKNEGIFLSKGSYITFLDSDDEYHCRHLEIRKKILLSNPQIEFLHGGLKVIGSEYVPDRFDYEKMIHLSECVAGGTFFIKREVAISFNGFQDIPFGSDADLFERINKAGVFTKKTEDATYIYHRETVDSITNTLTAFKKIPQFL